MVDLDVDIDIYKVCTLSLDLDYKPEIRVKLLNQWKGAAISAFSMVTTALEPYFTLREAKDNNYQVIIDGVFGNQEIDNTEAFKVFFTGEVKPAKVSGYDLSLGFDYFKDENYFRYPLYYLYYKENISADKVREEACNPNKEFFACFLVKNGKNGDGAHQRTEFFHELSKYKQVTSGGSHLNNIGRAIPKDETFLFLSQCKFTIAFENNLQYKGYMTEKLFQAYLSGTIPLYSSHPEAQKEVNKKAFISRQDFNNNKEMIEYIKELDQDDEKYCKMWNQPIITDSSRDYHKLQDKVTDFIKKKFVDPYYQKMKSNCVNSNE